MITSNLLEMTGLGGMTLTQTADSNLEHINKNALPTFFANFPMGTSLKNLDHFRQILSAQKYQKYDYSISYACLDEQNKPDLNRNKNEYYSA